MDDPEEEIDDDKYAALRRGDEQLARGEGRAWEEVRDEPQSKIRAPGVQGDGRSDRAGVAVDFT
jgi:hypothetical protein